MARFAIPTEVTLVEYTIAYGSVRRSWNVSIAGLMYNSSWHASGMCLLLVECAVACGMYVLLVEFVCCL